MMKKLVVLCAFLGLAVAAHASVDLTAWQNQAVNTTGNVVADNTGWTFDGVEGSGISFDYGALDAIDGKAVDGSTVEFIVNISDAGASIALGSMYSWSPGGEINVFKLEQWEDTGTFGMTTPGWWDKTLATESVFDEDVHVVFVRNNDSGTIDLYVNGVFMETESTKTNWRLDGGVGMLGSNNDNKDVCAGTIYAVGTYDAALTAEEISGLASASGVVPEPATLTLLGLGSLIAVRRRK